MAKDPYLERFYALPPEVRSALVSEKTVHLLQDIAKKHQLHLDQVTIMSDYVGQLIMGDIRSKDFGQLLGKALNTNPETTKAIADQLNEELFMPIRSHLREQEAGIDKEESIEETTHSEDRETLLSGIENPESIPVRMRTVEKQSQPTPKPSTAATEKPKEETSQTPTQKPTPPPAPAPTQPKPSILDRKREEAFSAQTQISTVDRINSDPYKESVQ